jgi:hypothetical protein
MKEHHEIAPNSQASFLSVCFGVASIVKWQCITIFFIVFIPGNKKNNGMSRVLEERSGEKMKNMCFLAHSERSAQFQNRFAM